MINKRAPFFVTILGGMALTLMVFNAIRFGVAIAKWDLMLAYMPSPGPTYIAETGLFWALAWLVAYLGIEFSWRWGGFFFMPLTFLYASYYWLDRLIFQPSAERSNAVFIFIMTLFFLGSIVVILALPESRIYFSGEDIESEEAQDVS